MIFIYSHRKNNNLYFYIYFISFSIFFISFFSFNNSLLASKILYININRVVSLYNKYLNEGGSENITKEKG